MNTITRLLGQLERKNVLYYHEKPWEYCCCANKPKIAVFGASHRQFSMEASIGVTLYPIILYQIRSDRIISYCSSTKLTLKLGPSVCISRCCKWYSSDGSRGCSLVQCLARRQHPHCSGTPHYSDMVRYSSTTLSYEVVTSRAILAALK